MDARHIVSPFGYTACAMSDSKITVTELTSGEIIVRTNGQLSYTIDKTMRMISQGASTWGSSTAVLHANAGESVLVLGRPSPVPYTMEVFVFYVLKQLHVTVPSTVAIETNEWVVGCDGASATWEHGLRADSEKGTFSITCGPHAYVKLNDVTISTAGMTFHGTLDALLTP